MIITFGDAKTALARHVRTGRCPDNADVAFDINEACDRLLRAQDTLYSLDILRIWTQNNSISLPRGYVSARMVRIDYIPRSIQTVPYEFLEFGPRNATNAHTQLVDEGVGHPCFFNVPSDQEYGLFCASSEQEDEVQSLQFRAIRNDGSMILLDGSPDLTLPIKFWNGGAEGSLTYQPTNQFSTTVSKVTQVLLPSGLKGYISFYAVDPDDGSMWFLSRYHPEETRPAYRRYRLPNFNNGTVFGSTTRGTDPEDGLCVECLCKKEHVTMSRDNDILTVQNLEALKLMLMAIHWEDSDINKSAVYKQLALENVKIQESNQTRGDTPTINFKGTFGSADVNIM